MTTDNLTQLFALSPNAVEAILLANLAIGYFVHSIGLSVLHFVPTSKPWHRISGVAIVIVVVTGVLLSVLYGVKAIGMFADLPWASTEPEFSTMPSISGELRWHWV